ncbi:MAG: hypothetical protein MI824_19460 [Hyphomicrobiales bacterium]|nr:hypothetical protein [Hyphomicrobiales bacterium]
MAPIKPTALPPALAPRPAAPGPVRAGTPEARGFEKLPTPDRAKPSTVAPQTRSAPGTPPAAPARGAGDAAPPSAGPLSGTAPGAKGARQLFTLQTLSAYAGLIVGETDAVSAPAGRTGASPASSAGTAEPAPARRPALPGSQLDIKV